MNWDDPPLPYLINANGIERGGEAAKADEEEEGERESTITNLQTASGDERGS